MSQHLRLTVGKGVLLIDRSRTVFHAVTDLVLVDARPMGVNIQRVSNECSETGKFRVEIAKIEKGPCRTVSSTQLFACLQTRELPVMSEESVMGKAEFVTGIGTVPFFVANPVKFDALPSVTLKLIRATNPTPTSERIFVRMRSRFIPEAVAMITKRQSCGVLVTFGVLLIFEGRMRLRGIANVRPKK